MQTVRLGVRTPRKIVRYFIDNDKTATGSRACDFVHRHSLWQPLCFGIYIYFHLQVHMIDFMILGNVQNL